MFRIAKWPIDCVKLLNEMKRSDRYPVQIGYAGEEVSDGLDAVTKYEPSVGIYQMVFHQNKIRYPYLK